MPIFNPSLIAISAAAQQIAAAAGASGDPEQTTKAGISLNAAIKHFNNRANWEYMLTEADPVTVVAPFSFNVVSATAGAVSALATAGHGLKVDDMVAGGLFQAGTRITSTATNLIGLNYAMNASLGAGIQVFVATATRDLYDLPSNWKAEYSVRLLGTQRVLWPIRQRRAGRGTSDETQASITEYYDVFPIGAKGKLRLLKPPGQSDIMLLRYYRRMVVPTTTATADALDIHQDYDDYLISWGKWHYLMDKSNAQTEQAQTWLTHAEKGILTMLADQTRRPDEDLMFFPGHSYSAPGPNLTHQIDWDY